MPETVMSPRDARYEALFERWNLKPEFVQELSVTDGIALRVDEAQVREIIHIAAPERVEEYARQMKGGAVFPPVVLMAPKTLIDGNTRVEAARKIGRTHLPAYRLELPDIKFAKMLAAALNQMGGARLTPAEANKAALAMIDLGWPDESVGRELGYAAESVRRWRREAQFVEKTDRLNLGDWAQRLTKRQKLDVAKIAHDEPFAELVKLIAETKPDAGDLKELTQIVEKAPSDEQAVESIRTARAEWVPIGPPPSKVYRNKSTQQLRMYLGGIVKLPKNPAEVYDADTAEKDLPRIREAFEWLRAVLAVYEERAKQ